MTFDGDTNDVVKLSGEWTATEVVTGFTRYTAGATHIKVDIDHDITVFNDGVFSLTNLNGSNGFRLDGADFSYATGKAISSAGT